MRWGQGPSERNERDEASDLGGDFVKVRVGYARMALGGARCSSTTLRLAGCCRGSGLGGDKVGPLLKGSGLEGGAAAPRVDRYPGWLKQAVQAAWVGRDTQGNVQGQGCNARAEAVHSR